MQNKKQTDNFSGIKGMMKVALYDAMGDSPTYRMINEFFVGEKNPVLISVPPRVYHGFKAIGTETAYFLSIPTLPYNYEENENINNRGSGIYRMQFRSIYVGEFIKYG